MKTCAEVIEELKKFPPDAVVVAYEGRRGGKIVIEVGGKKLGEIDVNE